MDPYLNSPKVDASEHVDPERDCCPLPSPRIIWAVAPLDEAQTAYLGIKCVVASYTQWVCRYVCRNVCVYIYIHNYK